MTKFKMPEVGDHLLLKIESQFSHEVILTSLDDDEYCAINLENGKEITIVDYDFGYDNKGLLKTVVVKWK